MKLISADDSVGFPHVKVGHGQAFIFRRQIFLSAFFFAFFNAHHAMIFVSASEARQSTSPRGE